MSDELLAQLRALCVKLEGSLVSGDDVAGFHAGARYAARELRKLLPPAEPSPTAPGEHADDAEGE